MRDEVKQIQLLTILKETEVALASISISRKGAEVNVAALNYHSKIQFPL